jgi:hypothetical protein
MSSKDSPHPQSYFDPTSKTLPSSAPFPLSQEPELESNSTATSTSYETIAAWISETEAATTLEPSPSPPTLKRQRDSPSESGVETLPPSKRAALDSDASAYARGTQTELARLTGIMTGTPATDQQVLLSS